MAAAVVVAAAAAAAGGDALPAATFRRVPPRERFLEARVCSVRHRTWQGIPMNFACCCHYTATCVAGGFQSLAVPVDILFMLAYALWLDYAAVWEENGAWA